MKKKSKNQLIINLHSHSFCFYLNNSKAYQAYMVMCILILFGASYYGKAREIQCIHYSSTTQNSIKKNNRNKHGENLNLNFPLIICLQSFPSCIYIYFSYSTYHQHSHSITITHTHTYPFLKFKYDL